MAKVYSIVQPTGKISVLAGEFLNDINRRGYSKHTVRAYRCALNYLAGALHDPDVSEVNGQDIVQALNRDDWTKETTAARQAAVKSFFGWLKDQNYISVDPAAGLGNIRRAEGVPRPIPEEDLLKILRTAGRLSLGLRCLFNVLNDTGMRVGEALSLDVEDVDWTPGQESITIQHGKGDRGRMIPVLPDMPCFNLLRRLCRERKAGPLFITGWKTRANYDWAYYWWGMVVENAGLAEKGYTIHQLRHSAITGWVRNGINLLVARRMAGHKALRTTERYCALDNKKIREELRLCGK
ncbi:MAG: tyrosine-type recombinase/integrase [Syntrophaceticus sp.]|jgi:site-specific recombinase XerD